MVSTVNKEEAGNLWSATWHICHWKCHSCNWKVNYKIVHIGYILEHVASGWLHITNVRFMKKKRKKDRNESSFEVWLITNEVHQWKWEYDACEVSDSKMRINKSVFQTLNENISLNTVKHCTFWKQLPFMNKRLVGQMHE